MRLDKVLRALKYSPAEIFLVFLSTALLFVAQCKIFFLSSPKIYQRLQNPPPAHVLLLFLKRFYSFKKTRLVSLVEACDTNLGWKPSCLRRTLVLSSMLRAMGFHPELKIGVHRDLHFFFAHSWFELDGMRLEMRDDGIPFLPLQPVHS